MSIDCVNGRIHDDHGYDRGICGLCKGSGCTMTSPSPEPLTTEELAKWKSKVVGFYEEGRALIVVRNEDIERLILTVEHLQAKLDDERQGTISLIADLKRERDILAARLEKAEAVCEAADAVKRTYDVLPWCRDKTDGEYTCLPTRLWKDWNFGGMHDLNETLEAWRKSKEPGDD